MPQKKTKNSWSPWSQSGGWKDRGTTEERIGGKDAGDLTDSNTTDDFCALGLMCLHRPSRRLPRKCSKIFSENLQCESKK